MSRPPTLPRNSHLTRIVHLSFTTSRSSIRRAWVTDSCPDTTHKRRGAQDRQEVCGARRALGKGHVELSASIARAEAVGRIRPLMKSLEVAVLQ